MDQAVHVAPLPGALVLSALRDHVKVLEKKGGPKFQKLKRGEHGNHSSPLRSQMEKRKLHKSEWFVHVQRTSVAARVPDSDQRSLSSSTLWPTSGRPLRTAHRRGGRQEGRLRAVALQDGPLCSQDVSSRDRDNEQGWW